MICLPSCTIIVFLDNVFLLLAKVILLRGPSVHRLLIHIFVWLVCLVILALLWTIFDIVNKAFSYWRVHIFSDDLLSLGEWSRLGLEVVRLMRLQTNHVFVFLRSVVSVAVVTAVASRDAPVVCVEFVLELVRLRNVALVLRPVSLDTFVCRLHNFV